ncbi:hypothetical protein L6654_02795 [Bradyrhizobium sp. WYCCWR 13023]|uniref:Uncharacterized protein n=1 Tax=Bradyrhizobium zhengyangense TaxID=2911009 RepID=A0A9X1R6T5_9BRAD|nr:MULTISPECIES: hypothetical protein [Bradyrhizobium]MCG2625538.1 hypothetical protein [Bradyrhizobium zhengyangense]MCG2641974.1 hypothetical protein [Bradyrhizobium zhengyangense]MDA9525096.1 hypothetical protein [Bradyrhizobium sp. CCBAU 11434]
MRFAIVLVSLLLFLTFVVSSARAWLSYNGYRELMPKPRVVGALAAIRVSMRAMHDPGDPDLSRECLAQLKSFRIAALIAATTWIATGLFIVTLRAFDLQRLFD